jgi:serine/threonine protein kinase
MPPDELKPPRRIGQVLQDKWVIERLVGEGGMASVYAARHRNGSVVALKILHPEISQREDIRERFLLEARAANRVAHAGGG